jgi:small subunit ribosomal protein S17
MSDITTNPTAESPATATAEVLVQALRKERVGRVISDKMQKSIVVAVERQIKHPIYGKFIKKTSTFHAHDERNEAHTGDLVRISETRPISKTTRWRLVEIVERAT